MSGRPEPLFMGNECGSGKVGEELEEQEGRLGRQPPGPRKKRECEGEKRGVAGGEDDGDAEGELEAQAGFNRHAVRLLRKQGLPSVLLSAAIPTSPADPIQQLLHGKTNQNQEEEGVDGPEKRALRTRREEDHPDPSEEVSRRRRRRLRRLQHKRRRRA